jgi:hypothetical protein
MWCPSATSQANLRIRNRIALIRFLKTRHLSEKVCASLCEFHICAGFMFPEPALVDGIGEASAIFGGRAAFAK